MLVLLLVNFALMAFDARSENNDRVVRVWFQATANFVQSPITYASTAVTTFFESVATMRSAQSENDKLKERVQQLEVQVQQNKRLADENKRLTELLDLKEKKNYKVLTAQVIGRDTSAWFDTAIIDRGSLDGVELNMPIVVNGGLVGRVTAVSPLTAQIDLITRDKSALGAIVGEAGNTNSLGVVRGEGTKELLKMDYVPGYVPIEKGEVIFTTGQGGVYPPGLRVGEITEVRTGSATVPHQIYIKPTAKITAMQEVAVLLYVPAPEAKYEEALPNAVGEDQKANPEADKK